jgi:hypothetical protein
MSCATPAINEKSLNGFTLTNHKRLVLGKQVKRGIFSAVTTNSASADYLSIPGLGTSRMLYFKVINLFYKEFINV